jgi:hypothetical protein
MGSAVEHHSMCSVLLCPGLQFQADDDEFWLRLQRLGPQRPLPEDMPKVRGG